MDLWVIETEVYSTIPSAPKMDPLHQLQFSVIPSLRLFSWERRESIYSHSYR